MKDFEFYKTIRASNKKDKLIKAFSKLHNFYNMIPDTKGCMDNINEGEKCKGWCCLLQTPQFLYSEFLLLWNFISKKWDDDEICDLFERCMLNAINPLPSKGCVFFDTDLCMCKVHKVRPYNCFLPDTWVYTSHGPRLIKNIMAGDMVFGQDGKLYEVEATSSHMYDGYIYGITHQGNDIESWCTGDHRWLVDERKDKRKKIKLEWVNATNLIPKKCKQVGNYLSLPMKYKLPHRGIKYINVLDFIKASVEGDRLTPFTNNDVSKSIPSKIEVCDEFLFMLGIYLAEGSSSAWSVSFSMHLDERHYLERIEKYLNSLGIKCSYPKVSHSKKLVVLRVGSSLMSRLLASLGGKLSLNKMLNENILSKMSALQMKKIYNAWDIGDGRKCLQNEFSTITISEKLAVQMCFILLANGIFSRIYKSCRGDRGHCSYDVHVFPTSLGNKTKNGQGSKVIFNDNYTLIPMNKKNVKEYQGPVIDIQVKDSETFITSSGIVHNCRIYGITPDEEFKPRYEKLKKEYETILGAVIKPQCCLVSTVDDVEITKKETDEWWEELVEIERSIGIPKDMITDAMGGSYRTPHDHVLLYNMPENVLNALSGIKQYDDEFDKKKAIIELIQVIKNVFKKN